MRWWSSGYSEEGMRQKSRIAALDFKTADFALCRDLLGGILWGVVHERREVQGS